MEVDSKRHHRQRLHVPSYPGPVSRRAGRASGTRRVYFVVLYTDGCCVRELSGFSFSCSRRRIIKSSQKTVWRSPALRSDTNSPAWQRSFSVLLGFYSSETLTCGVPQGCVLGPILFSLHTLLQESVFRKFCVRFHCFADDAQIYKSLNVTRVWRHWNMGEFQLPSFK